MEAAPLSYPLHELVRTEREVQLPERLPNHSIQHKSKALIHVEQTTRCRDDVQRRSDNSRVELADVEHDQHFLVDELA